MPETVPARADDASRPGAVGTRSWLARLGTFLAALLSSLAGVVFLFPLGLAPPGADPGPGLAVWQRHWRAGRHVHLPDSGHFIPFDRLERFVAELTRFLQSCPDGARPDPSPAGPDGITFR